MDQESAKNERHGRRTGNTECDGRDQGPAFLRIVGTLGRDHAAHIALTKGQIRVFLGSRRMTISNPVNHRGPNTRNSPQASADGRATQNQEPVLEDILGPLKLPKPRILPFVTFSRNRDGFLLNREVGKFGNSEQSERQRNNRQTIPQIQRIERPAERPRLWIVPRRGDNQADTGTAQTLEQGTATQHRCQ